MTDHFDKKAKEAKEARDAATRRRIESDTAKAMAKIIEQNPYYKLLTKKDEARVFLDGSEETNGKDQRTQ